MPRGIYHVTVPLQLGRNKFRLSLKDSLSNPKEFAFEIQGTGKHQFQVINSVTTAVAERVKDEESEKYLYADFLQADQKGQKETDKKANRWPLIFFPEQHGNSSRHESWGNDWMGSVRTGASGK